MPRTNADGVTVQRTRQFLQINKRAIQTCPGGEAELIKGRIFTAKPTNKTIEDEAQSFPDLYDSYIKMNSSEKFKWALSYGKYLNLSDEEIKAIYLFSMDAMTTSFYKSFKRAFIEGKDTYAVFHYWLQETVESLTVTPDRILGNTTLYAGYKEHITTDFQVGAKLSLPGFTPTTNSIMAAQYQFSSPGCTIIQFERSFKGAYVDAFYNRPLFVDVALIPPSEEFEVTGFGEVVGVNRFGGKANYRIIYLKPTGREPEGIEDGVGQGPSNELSLKLLITVFVCSYSL